MKRIYLLFILMIAAIANTQAAPRSCNLTISAHYDSSSTSGNKFLPIVNGYKITADGGTTANPKPTNGVHSFKIVVKNLGPDTVSHKDTVFVVTAFGQASGLYNLGGGKGMKVGDSVVFYYPVINLTPGSGVTSSKTDNAYQWCDSVFIVDRNAAQLVNDNNVPDNKTCNTISVTFLVTGINTVNGNNENFIEYYPNPAHGNLNVKYDFGTSANATVIMRDITGKVVLNRELGKNISGTQEYKLDISALNAGLYTAELISNGQRIVSKVSVQ